VLDCLVDKT